MDRLPVLSNLVHPPDSRNSAIEAPHLRGRPADAGPLTLALRHRWLVTTGGFHGRTYRCRPWSRDRLRWRPAASRPKPATIPMSPTPAIPACWPPVLGSGTAAPAGGVSTRPSTATGVVAGVVDGLTGDATLNGAAAVGATRGAAGRGRTIAGAIAGAVTGGAGAVVGTAGGATERRALGLVVAQGPVPPVAVSRTRWFTTRSAWKKARSAWKKHAGRATLSVCAPGPSVPRQRSKSTWGPLSGQFGPVALKLTTVTRHVAFRVRCWT